MIFILSRNRKTKIIVFTFSSFIQSSVSKELFHPFSLFFTFFFFSFIHNNFVIESIESVRMQTLYHRIGLFSRFCIFAYFYCHNVGSWWGIEKKKSFSEQNKRDDWWENMKSFLISIIACEKKDRKREKGKKEGFLFHFLFQWISFRMCCIYWR